MKTPFSDLSLKSFSLTEFGFLWSLFFAAWGPVLRYFGWLIALFGLALEFKRGKSFRGTLVILNREPTPLDARAELVFREPAGQVLAAVVSLLGIGMTDY